MTLPGPEYQGYQLKQKLTPEDRQGLARSFRGNRYYIGLALMDLRDGYFHWPKVDDAIQCMIDIQADNIKARKEAEAILSDDRLFDPHEVLRFAKACTNQIAQAGRVIAKLRQGKRERGL